MSRHKEILLSVTFVEFKKYDEEEIEEERQFYLDNYGKEPSKYDTINNDMVTETFSSELIRLLHESDYGHGDTNKTSQHQSNDYRTICLLPCGSKVGRRNYRQWHSVYLKFKEICEKYGHHYHETVVLEG